MRRALAKPVRACILRNWCCVLHIIFEALRYTFTFDNFHTLHCTFRNQHFILLILHCTFPNLHFSLHTLQSTLYTSYCLLYIPDFIFYIARFRPHTLHCCSFGGSKKQVETHEILWQELRCTRSQQLFSVAQFGMCCPPTVLGRKAALKHLNKMDTCRLGGFSCMPKPMQMTRGKVSKNPCHSFI